MGLGVSYLVRTNIVGSHFQHRFLGMLLRFNSSVYVCVRSKLPVQQNLRSDLEQELITFPSRPSSPLILPLLLYRTPSTLETFLSYSSSATLISISRVANLNSILIPLVCLVSRLIWVKGRRRKSGHRAVWGATPTL